MNGVDRAYIPAASTAATAVGQRLVRRQRRVGEDGGQSKAGTHLGINQMAAFPDPAKTRVAGSKPMAEHPHQLGLSFGQALGPLGGNLLLQSGERAGLAIVGGGNRIRAKSFLLQKVGKRKADSV